MALLSLLPAPALRLMRKLLLRYTKRMSVADLLEHAQHRALRTALQAASNSAAYCTLLQENKIDIFSLNMKTKLTSLPVLTKKNTFERFTLAQLARASSPEKIADVLTSSGRSGRSFGFKLTSRAQLETSWFDIDLGLQEAFNVDQFSTLLVNCLPMGVAFRSRAVTVANVSVREDMACAILRDVGPSFKQTLLCTDPLFIRRLLDEARATGVDWQALNTSVIMGEEMLVPAQRDYLATRMGIDLTSDSTRFIGSSYGVGELGLNLLFETRETLQMQRAMPNPATTPALFCYNPMRCYLEILAPDSEGFGELCFTMNDPQALISLPRYSTGDLGKQLTRQETLEAAQRAGISPPWLPVVALKGRLHDHPTDLPSVDAIKTLLYTHPHIADQLTGAFRLAKNAQGVAQLTLQKQRSVTLENDALHDQLQQLIAHYQLNPLELELLDAFEFPSRPLLDHERKFSYLAVKPD